MTVIRPNSVAGINSITVQSGNSLAVHKANGEIIRTITASSGISTFSSISVGTAYTDNSAGKSINIGLGASISQHNDNTLSLGTGGDERLLLTSDGKLGLNETSPAHRLVVGGDGYFGFNTPTDAARQVIFNVNRGSAGQTLANINWQWNSKNVAQVRGVAGADTTNKDDGHLAFFTSSANSLIERLRITSAGKMGVGTNDPNRTFTVQSNGGQMSINDTDNTNGGIFCNAGNFAFYARGNSNLGDGSVGGVLTVQTHTAGGSTAERLRITSTGDINVSTAATIKANGNATFSGIATAAGFALGDNDKITFGASEDLSVLHSGSTGVINNVTGDLHIKTTGSGDDIVLISNDDIELQPQAGEDGIKVIGNGAVELYHDSTKKFETASHGITVSGEIRDDRGNIRDIQSEPLSGTHSSRTLVDADAGKVVVMSGGVTLPAASGGGPFGGGSTLTILNKSGSAITLTQASGLTLYNTADATTGNRTLAARGIATVYYMYGGNEAYISGSGLS